MQLIILCTIFFNLGVTIVNGFLQWTSPSKRSTSESCRFSLYADKQQQEQAVVTSDIISDNNENEDSSMPKRKFMYMTKEQDEELKEKGDQEARLMKTPQPLRVTKIRGGGRGTSNTSGGFGGGSSSNKAIKKGKSKSKKGDNNNSNNNIQGYVDIIRTDGLVRIDNVLKPDLCDELRDYLIDLRARATKDIEQGLITDTQQRFADVLLNQNRCDLKIPLGPLPVLKALDHILDEDSIVRHVIESVYNEYDGIGNEATLYELNCFMSNSGARRQLVHADSVCLQPIHGLQSELEPVILTCFIALQDIDETMGPTIWMPGTHTIDYHNQFFETGINDNCNVGAKDHIMKTKKSFMGTLSKGSCAIFDPRVLHCAGANVCTDPTWTRALFYVSFKNPKIDHPGSPSTSGYGIGNAELTIDELRTCIKASLEGKPAGRLDLMKCFP